MVTHKYVGDNMFVDMKSGKKLAAATVELGDHSRGKNNMVIFTMPDGTRFRVGRKHVDESESIIGPGAVNTQPPAEEVSKKRYTRKEAYARTHARTHTPAASRKEADKQSAKPRRTPI